MESSAIASFYPTAQHIELLHLLSAIAYSIHFLYLAIVVGGGTFSLVFLLLHLRDEDPGYLGMARMALPRRWLSPGMILFLGVVPLFSLSAVFQELSRGAPFGVGQYGAFTILACALGFLLLAVYRRLLGRSDLPRLLALSIGVFGLLAAVAGYFQLVQIEALALYPERWPFLDGRIPFFPVGNVLPRFLLFTVLSLGAGAILLLFLSRMEPHLTDALPEDRVRPTESFLTYVGAGFALLVAPISLWNLYTMPVFALSRPALWVELVFVASAVALAYALLGRRGSAVRRFPPTSALLFLLALVISYAAQNELARARASRELERTLAAKAEEIREAIVAEREERLAQTRQVDGAQVFQKVCSSCHRFDSRLVGPPFRTVVPKYRGKRDDLVAFILNPVKRNPAYPPMPNPGLKKFEAVAVAKYLLEQLAGQAPGDTTQ